MSEITYNALKDLRSFKEMPALTLDQRWYKLVPEVSKTDEIKYWEKQVNQLIKRQGQINNDINEVKKIKKRVIKNIVDNMESDEDSETHRKRMSQDERLIHEAKAKISSLQEEYDEIPKQLQKANQMLMLETVKMCYKKINENNADIEVLDKWIEETRIKLKKNLLIRQDKESMNEQMYSNMHAILGPEIMEELDHINND